MQIEHKVTYSNKSYSIKSSTSSLESTTTVDVIRTELDNFLLDYEKRQQRRRQSRDPNGTLLKTFLHKEKIKQSKAFVTIYDMIVVCITKIYSHLKLFQD